MIEYNAFLAQINPQQLQLLATFTAGERAKLLATDTVAVEDFRNWSRQLFDMGLLSRVAEGYELINGDFGGVLWYTFDGYATEAAKGYVWQLARERVYLSRDPLPPGNVET
jgi:hypothetical protein